MGQKKNLLRELMNGAIPCDGCAHRARCQTESLSCADFSYWVNTGKIHVSEKRVPKKIRNIA
ncbi:MULTISPECIES: hypothetical protein [Acidithiobacillus]|uniref:Uncharacterized protein n=1 Tax=Acidithiobacillus thiooxidans ATCC 19377 TaxID=637390 RepID=A0A543Q1V5_ACITH|nr:MULTISPECIES: hypothetical protein [Acidithiobacillus]MBU2751231.1 hypothetical protein [Acidithiobacillus thiooxidans]MBU2835270.1 hypothetical protein [Acidithiobacillus thiooxidans]MDD5280714.1 hypothetical protein [Acidithiobacillus sp.]MDX5935544.1 hypothetical protein [Acidithiobacillus thiooxidans]QFX96096.1 hypothetical protein GCD22_01812 [Acidithiobacillus thiooxidans ATCC 19377]